MMRQCILAVGAVLVACQTATSGVIAFQLLEDPLGSGNSHFQAATDQFTFYYGYEFSISTPIQITRVGVFDYGNDYFSAGKTADVQIWDASTQSSVWSISNLGSGLTPGTVYTSLDTGAQGVFYWQDLTTPVDLGPGTYRIAAKYNDGSGNEFASAPTTSVSKAPDVTFSTAVYDWTPPDYPEASASEAGSYAYFGPNFEYTAVPEPGGVGLIVLLGLAVSGALHRRKKRS